jgi:cobalt-zinc-cadmium efflux system protein
MSTTQTALSVHLVIDKEQPDNTLIAKIQEHLSHTFGIEHVTVQMEKESADFHCALEHEI